MRDWFAKIALILAFAAPAAAQLLIPGLSLQGRIIAYASLFLLLVPIALVAIRHVPPRTVVAESGFGWRHEIGASLRSEGRRVGQECVRTWRSRWSPYH